MSQVDYQKIVQLLASFSTKGDLKDPKNRKRVRIIRAATELFIRLGYRKTSVDQIARQAHVAKGTVYLYFKNKSEILIQAIIEEKRRYLPQLIPVFAPEFTGKQRLRAYLRTVLQISTDMPLSAKLLSGDLEFLTVLEEMDEQQRDRSLELGLELFCALVGDVGEAKKWSAEKLRERAQVLFGLIYMSGLIKEKRIRGALSVERFMDVLVDLLMDGIAP